MAVSLNEKVMLLPMTNCVILWLVIVSLRCMLCGLWSLGSGDPGGCAAACVGWLVQQVVSIQVVRQGGQQER